VAIGALLPPMLAKHKDTRPYLPPGLLSSHPIHPSAEKVNSRKSISTILNILPYRGGAMRHFRHVVAER
jgi:hypothetical protein